MSSDSDSEEVYCGLRFEWLQTLKKEELKTLCQNRGINTEKSTKKACIKNLLKSTSLKEYASLKKASLSLELKAKGVEHSDKAKKADLIKLLNKNKKVKFSNDVLSKLNLSELQNLCKHRSIEMKDANSKKTLSELLEDTNVPDPKYTQSMTSKQLMAEMKGRGLSVTKMDKSKMLEMLNSGVSFEDKQLEFHVKNENIDNIIANTENILHEFINYMKENTNKIQKLTKKNKHLLGANNNKPNKAAKTRDYLINSEWLQLEDALRTARDEIIDTRTMIESYGGSDLGKDEILPKNKKFENVINYNDDSDIDAKDEETETVYVVYNDDQKLIMDQNRDAILCVFDNEHDAEQRKQKLLEDSDCAISIQEIIVNDYNGADPKDD